MNSIAENSSASQLSAHDLRVLAHLTMADLRADIRKLENQISVAKDELSDYEDGHKERPYRREFMATVRREYRRWLRELRNQIAKTYALLRAKEAMAS